MARNVNSIFLNILHMSKYDSLCCMIMLFNVSWLCGYILKHAQNKYTYTQIYTIKTFKCMQVFGYLSWIFSIYTCIY